MKRVWCELISEFWEIKTDFFIFLLFTVVLPPPYKGLPGAEILASCQKVNASVHGSVSLTVNLYFWRRLASPNERLEDLYEKQWLINNTSHFIMTMQDQRLNWSFSIYQLLERFESYGVPKLFKTFLKHFNFRGKGELFFQKETNGNKMYPTFCLNCLREANKAW